MVPAVSLRSDSTGEKPDRQIDTRISSPSTQFIRLKLANKYRKIFCLNNSVRYTGFGLLSILYCTYYMFQRSHGQNSFRAKHYEEPKTKTPEDEEEKRSEKYKEVNLNLGLSVWI